MSSPSDDLKQWPTSLLVDRFIALLSPFGSLPMSKFLPIPGLKNRANEFKTAIEEARPVADELNRRRDPDAGDRLMGNLNPGVRMGVFAMLTPGAPKEIVAAGMLGPLSGLPDETACGLFERALTTGEESVSLAELSEDELVDRLVEFCLRNFMAWNFFNLHSDQEQIDASNSIITEIMRVLVALKQRGALGRLVPLLKHTNQNVRLWAADGALFVDEAAALSTLNAIIDEGAPESARMYLPPGPGLTNVFAKRALDLWRKERRGVHGLNPGHKVAP